MTAQSMEALSVANRVRIARAVLKREVFAGQRTAASVLLQEPEEVATMTVFELLDAQQQWGKYRARKLLAVALVPESKTIGTLTDRQRKVLVDLLEWRVA